MEKLTSLPSLQKVRGKTDKGLDVSYIVEGLVAGLGREKGAILEPNPSQGGHESETVTDRALA